MLIVFNISKVFHSFNSSILRAQIEFLCNIWSRRRHAKYWTTKRSVKVTEFSPNENCLLSRFNSRAWNIYRDTLHRTAASNVKPFFESFVQDHRSNTEITASSCNKKFITEQFLPKFYNFHLDSQSWKSKIPNTEWHYRQWIKIYLREPESFVSSTLRV